MKTTKKIIGLVLAVVLLISASVMGTLAYLTSTDTVTNTFAVGNVAITLDEAPVDENGAETEGARVKANNYKLLPGHKYDKDPTVHVAAGSENCWLFVKVENGIADIEAATTIADQMTAKGWTLVEGYTNIYAYEYIAEAGADVIVFETFTVKGDVANEALAAYAESEITITAYAIQADGFDTAAAAWAAANLA